jgi:hypothetical protein
MDTNKCAATSGELLKALLATNHFQNLELLELDPNPTQDPRFDQVHIYNHNKHVGRMLKLRQNLLKIAAEDLNHIDRSVVKVVLTPESSLCVKTLHMTISEIIEGGKIAMALWYRLYLTGQHPLLKSELGYVIERERGVTGWLIKDCLEAKY